MTAESCDIKWEVPEDDGGAPITGYIIEKRDISRKSWSDSGKISADKELSFTVLKLLEGQQYLFRVSAENKYGTSEPAEIPEPVTAKNPYGKYQNILFVSVINKLTVILLIYNTDKHLNK